MVLYSIVTVKLEFCILKRKSTVAPLGQGLGQLSEEVGSYMFLSTDILFSMLRRSSMALQMHREKKGK